jgi:hypothetical protein
MTWQVIEVKLNGLPGHQGWSSRLSSMTWQAIELNLDGLPGHQAQP